LLLKDWRRRPEGGGEWESIKIPRRNLAYVPKSGQRPSLLTRSRPHSYSKAIGPQNQVRNHSGNTNGCSQDPDKIDNRNQLKTQFISSQAFHRTPGGRVWEITAGERFEQRILESFEPATQKLYRDLPATIHTRIPQKIHNLDRYQNWQCMKLEAALRLPWPWVATTPAEK
jgi:hypothetical protein